MISHNFLFYFIKVDELFVCGGGAHNCYLMELLDEYMVSSSPVKTTDSLGIDVDWVEAMAFAWFAFAYLENIEASLPEVTGASKKAVLGALYKVK